MNVQIPGQNQTNTFFISLRFVLINDRDVDVNKGKKPLFKKK